MSTVPEQSHHRLSAGGIVDRILANPLAGLAPWIVYSLVEGEGRLEESAAIAFGLALAILMVGWLRGSSPKLLEFSDVVFFGALAIFVAVASEDTHAWLERWSGEVANIALVAIAVGSILIRQPFTLAYAKEQAPRELWSNPVFLRTNYVLTGVWAIAFAIEAASGLYGDWVLRQLEQPLDRLDHPDAAADRRRAVHALVPRARARRSARSSAASGPTPPPPVGDFVAQVTPWISIVGVIALASDAAPWWVGVAFIAVGIGSDEPLQAGSRARSYTGSVTPEELANLAHLRRARDLMDREYARPLDVAALARAALMSTAHFSRQFRATYGETPYAYLMTRRIERAKALLRRGDLSVTEVCLAVGCTSLGSFSARFTELVGETPTAYRARDHGALASVPGCVAKDLTRPSRTPSRIGEARAALGSPSLAGMDLTLSQCFVLVHDPDVALAFYRDTLGLELRNDVAREGFRWITVGAASQPGVAIVLTNYLNGSPADGDALAALVAKGALNGVHFHTDDLDATFEKLRASGAEIVQEPTEQPWGTRDCAVRDPSGNLVRIDQPPAA